MATFPRGAVCVIGLSKAPSQNPITFFHQALIGSFVADAETGMVYQVQFNTICRITNSFIAEQLVGLSLFNDIDEMIFRIQTRYFGDSRRAIIVIIRDAAAKLRDASVQLSDLASQSEK